MPGGQQVGRSVPQGLLLVVEDLQCQSGIQFRVVDPPALELSVLVMLDQVVIGVTGKGEGIESEGVHRWQLQ